MGYTGWNGISRVEESDLPTPADLGLERLVEDHENYGECPLEGSGHDCPVCEEEDEDE